MGATALPSLAPALPADAIARPRGRDLSATELEAFVAELAERPEIWIDLVKHDASQRLYEQLFADEHLTAWLICWMDEQDTGFHDHDVSSGAVAVVSGDGLRDLFHELGVHTIDGGPTLNPSTYDLLAAIHEVQAEEVVVLPNSANVIMAAEHAAELSDKQVLVAPTTSQQARCRSSAGPCWRSG